MRRKQFHSYHPPKFKLICSLPAELIPHISKATGNHYLHVPSPQTCLSLPIINLTSSNQLQWIIQNATLVPLFSLLSLRRNPQSGKRDRSCPQWHPHRHDASINVRPRIFFHLDLVPPARHYASWAPQRQTSISYAYIYIAALLVYFAARSCRLSMISFVTSNRRFSAGRG